MRYIITSIILFVLIAVPSWAATSYYVCPAANIPAASDSNAGTDPAAPWETAQKTDAVNEAVTSGDTVYFCNQGTWESYDESGYAHVLSLTAGVKYDGTTWGTGTSGVSKAKFLCTGSHAQTGDPDYYAMVAFYRYGGYVASGATLYGFDIDLNNYGQVGIDAGIYLSAALSNITIKDVIVHNNASGGAVEWPYGIIVSAYSNGSVDGVTIENVSSHDNYNGGINVYVNWTVTPMGHIQNITIRNTDIYNITGSGIDIRNYVDNVTVEFSTIHSSTNGMNIGCSPVSEAGELANAPNGIIIRYNLIYSNNNSGMEIFNGQDLTETADIYSNIFYENGATGTYGAFDIKFKDIANSTGWGTSVFKLYNNVFYKTLTPDTTMHHIGVGNDGNNITGSLAISLVNNIFYAGSSFTPIYDRYGNITTHANNLYYRSSGTGLVQSPAATTYTSEDIATWDSSPQTTNPSFTGGTLPTHFDGTYQTDLLPDTTYFSLAAGSPALNAGDTLGSPYNGCINGAGLATPATRPVGAYDIGAYEYTTASIQGCVFSGAVIH